MRHNKKFNHLSRKAPHRKAMLANMACSLITHKRINTTVAKAKALKQYVEPLVTRSKSDSTHNRRVAFSQLRQKEAVTELFREVAAKVGDRPGGYTRIIKLGNRLGDSAEMAMIELVDYNDIYTSAKPKKKKTTRRGRSKKAKEAAPAQQQEAGDGKEGEEAEEPKAKEAVEKPKAEEKPVEETKAETKTEAKEEAKTEDAEAKDDNVSASSPEAMSPTLQSSGDGAKRKAADKGDEEKDDKKE